MSLLENAFALVVGVANYENVSPLPVTVLNDARAIHEILVSPQHCGYDPKKTKLLLDREATAAALRQGLAALASASDSDSTVFIYVSSHGARVESGEHAGEYLLPIDASCIDAQTLAGTSISGAEFSEALARIPARKVAVVLDCCHASGIGELKDPMAAEIKLGLDDSLYDRLKAGTGRVVIASSRARESSYILPGAANSLFTQHFIAALQGGANGSGGLIRIFDTFDYLQSRVTSDQPAQHPVFKAELEDNFPIALYCGGKGSAPPLPVAGAGFNYDVFLSYRHRGPDEQWVRNVLVPRLKSEGLRVCVDYECFRPGRFIVTEMERAVEQSRYTVSVLSPDYLGSGFTEFEEVLAQHLGLEESHGRYLGILRQPCSPSLRVRARFWLDMSTDSEFATNFPRLVDELCQPLT